MKCPDCGKILYDTEAWCSYCNYSFYPSLSDSIITIKDSQTYNPYQFHKTAIIDSGAKIGESTKIWHWTHVMSNAVIGSSCIIGQGCFVAGIIGDGCKIQNNVSVFNGVELEDFVFVGPHTTFVNVKYPRAAIEKKHEFEKTLVKKHATIGAGAVIITGITIGEYALIGSGSVVTKDMPDYALAYGNPARIRGVVDENGVPIK